jgi:hypothetical protein
MPKRARLSPHKTLYTLEEAATASGYKPAELLHFGAIGRVAFCTRVPDNVAVFTVDKVFLPGGRWHKVVDFALSIELARCQGPSREDGLSTLTLDKEHCRTIEALGRTLVYAFGSGGRIDEDYSYAAATPHDRLTSTENRPRRVMPRRLDDVSLPLIQPWPHSRLFVTYSKELQPNYPRSSSMGTPTNLELAAETIYIEAGELASLLNERVAIAGRQTVTLNISQKLVQLNRAAEFFWGNEAREQDWYPPKNQKVEAYLVEKKWPAYLAKRAASIIRPEYGGNSNGNPDTPEDVDCVSPELVALNTVAKELWCDVDLNDPDGHPEDTEVVAELTATYGFSQIKAEVGAAIIRPVENKGGRRPGK